MSKYRKSFDDIYCRLWKILDKPKLSSRDRQRCKHLLKQMWREHHLGRFCKPHKQGDELMTKYTVFYREDGDDVIANTLEYFLEKGKTYEDIQKRLQENPNCVEKQDKILWNVTRMWEKRKEKISKYEESLHYIDEIMINVNAE